MAYFTEYETGLIGTLVLASNGEQLDGCWFDNDRFFGSGIAGVPQRCDNLPIFQQARAWLPLGGSPTQFQLRVREAMLDIPYGQTTTYGAIAKRIQAETGRRQSAQAVGGAVGRNQLCVIVPCHRVVGANGDLTGFGGGIDTKIKLLEHERAMRAGFTRPTRGTALVGVENASNIWGDGASASE